MKIIEHKGQYYLVITYQSAISVYRIVYEFVVGIPYMIFFGEDLEFMGTYESLEDFKESHK